MANQFYRPNDTAESRLRETVFVVEATSFEQHVLWERHSKQGSGLGSEWHQISPGWLVEVGRVGQYPVTISVSWFEIDSCLVCFYEAASRVVDHGQIEKWFKENYSGTWDGGTRRAITDANNFHHCLQAIDEQEAADADK